MNQLSRIHAAPAWHQDAEAATLIASLRRNPPELLDRVEHYPLTTDRWTEFAPDKRIERLRRIENEAFLAAEAIDPEHGAQTFIDTQPSVDHILAGIGPHQALFLGVCVNRAPLSSFADIVPGARHPTMGEAA